MTYRWTHTDETQAIVPVAPCCQALVANASEKVTVAGNRRRQFLGVPTCTAVDCIETLYFEALPIFRQMEIRGFLFPNLVRKML